MARFICFFEDKNLGPLYFVHSYERRKWFRKERIAYSIERSQALTFDDSDNATIEKVLARIKSDYPESRLFTFTFDDKMFATLFQDKRFWGICKINGKPEQYLWYAGVKDGSVVWACNAKDALLCFDEDTEIGTLNVLHQIQRGDRIVLVTVYLDLTNELLTPKFLLTCTSKRDNKRTKFFAREEGRRLRLVNTSFAASKLTYRESLQLFERLRIHNKNFSYAVIPDFDDNVNCKDLDEYTKDHKVNRMVQLELKLGNSYEDKITPQA